MEIKKFCTQFVFVIGMIASFFQLLESFFPHEFPLFISGTKTFIATNWLILTNIGLLIFVILNDRTKK